jgi:hypothetical protein
VPVLGKGNLRSGSLDGTPGLGRRHAGSRCSEREANNPPAHSIGIGAAVSHRPIGGFLLLARSWRRAFRAAFGSRMIAG